MWARRGLKARNAALSKEFIKMEQFWRAARLPKARHRECIDKFVIHLLLKLVRE
jgi:hypothetical protein